MLQLDSTMEQQPPIYQPNEKPRNYAFLKLVLAWVVAIGIAVMLQSFVFQSYQVFGQSMQPTLDDGDYLIISKLGPTWSSITNNEYIPERGEIVVVDPEDSPRLIKRVIGLPGERVEVKDGNLTIINDQHPNGFQPYDDINMSDSEISGSINTDIPEGQLFVVGDNTGSGGSSDSRNQLGTVPTDNVIGSLVLRLWPIEGVQRF